MDISSSKHILVVEDERSLATALTRKLEGNGFSVATAFNGQEVSSFRHHTSD